VQEDDRLVSPDAPLPDVVDHPGRRLRRVDRVDDDALGPGEEPDRLARRGRRDGVARADVLVVDDHLLRGEPQVHAEQLVQEQVALKLVVLAPAEHQDAPQPEPARRRGRLPGVVGLGRAHRQNHIRALAPGVGHQVLQLPGLVPAEGQAGQVVSLDQNPGTAQRGAQPGRLVQRSRQRREPQPRYLLQWHPRRLHAPELVVAMIPDGPATVELATGPSRLQAI